jgi:hypothetical protein
LVDSLQSSLADPLVTASRTPSGASPVQMVGKLQTHSNGKLGPGKGNKENTGGIIAKLTAAGFKDLAAVKAAKHTVDDSIVVRKGESNPDQPHLDRIRLEEGWSRELLAKVRELKPAKKNKAEVDDDGWSTA